MLTAAARNDHRARAAANQTGHRVTASAITSRRASIRPSRPGFVSDVPAPRPSNSPPRPSLRSSQHRCFLLLSFENGDPGKGSPPPAQAYGPSRHCSSDPDTTPQMTTESLLLWTSHHITPPRSGQHHCFLPPSALCFEIGNPGRGKHWISSALCIDLCIDLGVWIKSLYLQGNDFGDFGITNDDGCLEGVGDENDEEEEGIVMRVRENWKWKEKVAGWKGVGGSRECQDTTMGESGLWLMIAGGGIGVMMIKGLFWVVDP
ncbi:hypothetical protein LR48_Vigan01g080800 [Vigna angularis]|uniref:Uncharacterized protein n=1 Tax=Phaseolus angularis TaxID=3914 RepID=A0A0L9TKY8_PHAAN|nr:hypothetical protein LR48_Vigan01g080800 [Vigna angularis]